MLFRKPNPLRGLRCVWVANEGAAEITLNSILTLLEVAPDLSDQIYIGCIDDGARAAFLAKFPQAHLMDFREMDDWTRFALVDVEGIYGEYVSIRFRDVSFARYFALRRLLGRSKKPVLYSDGDIAFRRDPRPPLLEAAARSGAAVLMQNDVECREDARFAESGFAIPPPDVKRNICTGFSCWLDAGRGLDLIARLLAARPTDVEKTHDQKVLNRILADIGGGLVATLPERTFPNGSYVFDRTGRLKAPSVDTSSLLSDACMVHANWMVGMATKTAALRNAGLWRL